MQTQAFINSWTAYIIDSLACNGILAVKYQNIYSFTHTHMHTSLQEAVHVVERHPPQTKLHSHAVGTLFL